MPHQGLEEIAGLVVTHAQQFFPATETSLELVHGEELLCVDARGTLAGTPGHRVPVTGSLSGSCLRELQPDRCLAILNDFRPDVRLCAQLGARTLLAIPVMDRARPVGVLKMASRDPSAFDEAEIDLAQLLAGMTGSALGRLTGDKEAVARLNAELEQRLETRTAELLDAHKELETFSYSVSHDLRAPLRAILGFSRILSTEHSEGLDPEILRYLGIVSTNAVRLGELIDSLLALSRLHRQPMVRQPVDMQELVRRSVDELRPEKDGRPVTLNIRQLPSCTGDPAMLKRVWVNLLSNALKYTRRREVAEISIDCREDLEVMPGRMVYVVRDNGVGFDPRYKNKLFGVFQRLHRAEDYEGTGIGLAVAQRIIRRHEGQIWAEAQLNQGATFFFTL